MLIDKLLEQDRFRRMHKVGIYLKDAEVIKISSNVIDEKDLSDIKKVVDVYIKKMKAAAKSEKLTEHVKKFSDNNFMFAVESEKEKFARDFKEAILESTKAHKSQGVLNTCFPFQRAKFPFNNLLIVHDSFTVWISHEPRETKTKRNKSDIMDSLNQELDNLVGEFDLYSIVVFQVDKKTLKTYDKHGVFLQNKNDYTIPLVYITLDEIYENGVLIYDRSKSSIDDTLYGGNKLDYLIYNYLAIKIAALCNCKNIELKKDNSFVPSVVKQRRSKQNKLPIKSYYTIWIRQSRGKSNSQRLDQWTNRVHIARGHFKNYTADKPLFGEHVGSWWWQPYFKGDKTKGIVVKDYLLDKDKL